jgi:hypothetical protein
VIADARKQPVWGFEQAREYARSFGFDTEAEFKEYRCPGAYSLPREPEKVYEGKGWQGWDDFLGVKPKAGNRDKQKPPVD